MSTIPDATYGSTGGSSHVMYLNSEKNTQLVAAAQNKLSGMSTASKVGIFVGGIGLLGLIMTIGCAADGCFSSNLDPVNQKSCDQICSSTVKVLSIGSAVIGALGTCLTCAIGLNK
jgi:hypothetical protein